MWRWWKSVYNQYYCKRYTDRNSRKNWNALENFNFSLFASLHPVMLLLLASLLKTWWYTDQSKCNAYLGKDGKKNHKLDCKNHKLDCKNNFWGIFWTFALLNIVLCLLSFLCKYTRPSTPIAINWQITRLTDWLS